MTPRRSDDPMVKPHESLDKTGLFRSLDPKKIAGLDHRCSWRHAQAKEWLFEQDDLVAPVIDHEGNF